MKVYEKAIVVIFKKLLKFFEKISSRVFDVIQHNGVNIFDYPEDHWVLVPFPAQKGPVFNADNLATVNRHAFISEPRFCKAKSIAEDRWRHAGKIRDISWRLNVILWATSRALRLHNDNPDSVFVECGTGRGYMAAAIAEYHEFQDGGPDFFLIDTFSSSLIINGGVLKPSPAGFAYSDDEAEIREYFSRYPKVKVIAGFIPTILDEIPARSISFLHIDLNNAEAECSALNHLAIRLVSGSIIVFDDYGGPGGEQQAIVHEDFAAKNGKEILALPTGQGIIVW